MKTSIWKDQVVYIPGGSSGIGLATARLFCRAGAHVCIFARRLSQLSLAAQELTEKRIDGNQKVGYFQLDVTDEIRVNQVFAQAVDEVGPPDILINSAGRALPNYVKNISTEQFEETVRINLQGTWHTVKAVLPYMEKRGSGYIVNISSIAGFVGVFGYADYCASKFAVQGLSEVLRSELKPKGIKVSVLCPPDTDTPCFEVENRTKPPETREISAVAKLLSPDDVASALLKGMKRRRFLIIPDIDGKVTLLARRLAPWLLTYVMDSKIKKVQQNRQVTSPETPVG